MRPQTNGMDDGSGITRYEDLGNLADNLLGVCDEDAALLAEKIGQLPPEIQDALLSSDFLNAYQVFFFFFRTQPGDIEKERMILLPASELQSGMLLTEIELYELIFAVLDHEPVMIVSDGDHVLARYTGTSAYRQALEYIRSQL